MDKDLLKEFNIKKTKPRSLLLELLEKSKKPITVNELFDSADKSVDKVTVYRTVDLFERSGLVRRVETLEREVRYELQDPEHDHHHVICIKCKKVEDFTGCQAESLIEKALEQVGGFSTVSHHSFDIFGICNSCTELS